jgi:hypothetical protein
VKAVAIRVAVGGLLATAFLTALALGFPGQRWNLLAGYELVLGALAVGGVVAALRTLRPRGWEARTPFDPRRTRPEDTEPTAELERIDRLLVLGSGNAFDAHHRLRPLFRELALERLRGNHAVDLDREPERARELLGNELWEFVRADRDSGRRSGPGLPLDRAGRFLDTLEAV